MIFWIGNGWQRKKNPNPKPAQAGLLVSASTDEGETEPAGLAWRVGIMEIVTLLRLIAALAEAAAEKQSNRKYWNGELKEDVSRIRQAVSDLESVTERR